MKAVMKTVPQLIRPVVVGLLVASFWAVPASADNLKTPPGDPCLRNNGNPCRGNNGNLGDQGNANHEKVKIDKKPPPISLGMPPVTDRGVFISQVGDGNAATVVQTARNGYARV